MARFLLVPLFLVAAALGTSSQAQAQTETVTYTLDGVMFGTSGAQMTGTFTWTYQVGDFENGLGTFTDIYIPWYGSELSDLDWTIELDQIEVTMSQSWHGLGVDVMLRLSNDLNLTGPAHVDTSNSTYHIEQGNHQGNVTAGSIVPEPGLGLALSGTCPNLTFEVVDATPNGQVALLYAYQTGSFVIPQGMPCAGTTLGLGSSVALGTMMTADPLGNITLSATIPAGACGAVYLQALDLSSCDTSTVVAVP